MITTTEDNDTMMHDINEKTEDVAGMDTTEQQEGNNNANVEDTNPKPKIKEGKLEIDDDNDEDSNANAEADVHGQDEDANANAEADVHGQDEHDEKSSTICNDSLNAQDTPGGRYRGTATGMDVEADEDIDTDIDIDTDAGNRNYNHNNNNINTDNNNNNNNNNDNYNYFSNHNNITVPGIEEQEEDNDQEDKITADSEAMADIEKMCGNYQSINACVPACICENEAWAAMMAESNKQAKESMAKLDIECELKCGASLNAANPLTIGFTSVALIVAALFAVL